MPAPPPRGNPRLIERIRREIREAGPISFSRFMELALYDPRDGYYSTPGRIGTRGDFYTASDVGPALGLCLARQLLELDRALGAPDPFHLVEFGAGRGLLARDVLDALRAGAPELARRVRPVLVDRSPAMREQARRRVPGARVLAPEEYHGRHVGCVLGVELFDALPVHRVRRRAGRLREVFVGLDREQQLVEREGEPLAETLRLAERYGAAPGEGDEAEVAAGAGEQFDALEAGLRAGFILLIDYGHAATELYGPRHRRGTLLAYHGHTAGEDYLARVGEQDLTAHVNFSALEDRARERGLALLGRTTQDRFLIANGVLEAFEQHDLAAARDPRRVKARLQAMQLIHPHAMGRRFQVAVFSKALEPPPVLAGLADPFA